MNTRMALAGPLLLLASTFVGAAEPYRPLEDAAAKTVSALEELAAWCKARKLNRERAGVLEAILVLDPEHAAARRGLGFRLDSEEGWVRKRGWRRPKTTRKEHHAAFAERWRGIVDPLVTRVLKGLAERRKEVGLERRDEILSRLLALDPDEKRIRELRGEVKDGALWILAETARAKVRRPGLKKTAKVLLARQPLPKPGAYDDVDEAIGLAWTGVYASETTRAVGTVKPGELRDAVRLSDATGEFFRHALSVDTRHGDGFTIHLLPDPKDRPRYLERHPKLRDDLREFAPKLNSVWSESVWNVGIWVADRPWRTELVSRQTLVMYLGLTFGITTRQGALHEGIGLYLAEAMTGSRRVWMIKPSDYAAGGGDFSARMKDPEADWRELARELLRTGQTADYPVLLGRDVNALTAPDVLHAYALAAFLIEGQPKGATRFLGHPRRGESAVEACAANLSMSLPSLERRAARWLAETR